MATVTTKKKSSSRGRRVPAEAGASELGGLAIVASALVHIAQASRNSDLEQQKARLLDVLRAWQQALSRANARVVDLQRMNDALQQSNVTLSNQVAQLEQEKAHWEAQYARLVKDLDALKAATPTPAEVSQ